MSGTALTTIARQNGWVTLPDSETHILRFQIRSASSNNQYTVAMTRKNRIWQCECLGYRGNKKFDSKGRRSCKHLAEIVPTVEAVLAAPQATPRITGRR
jgi:hypothetical protein